MSLSVGNSYEGTISQFFEAKGWGFIVTAGEPKVFFHRSAIKPKVPVEGLAVRYVVAEREVKGEKKLRAERVEVLA